MDGVTLLNMSYDDALKLLQNTGATVKLVLSQIFQPNASNCQKQESPKQNEPGRVGTINYGREQNVVTRKERPTVDQSYQNSIQFNVKPKKTDDEAKNRNGCMATVKSVPDLPKVGLYDGQFTLHTTHPLLFKPFPTSSINNFFQFLRDH